MANNGEESNPLLGEEEVEEKHQSTTVASASSAVSIAREAEPVNQPPPPQQQQPEAVGAAAATVAIGWTAEGLPMSLVREAAMAEPAMRRDPWDTGLCACLGRNDEFCGSDLEVCMFSLWVGVLGSVAPCVLHGSNAERLESSPGNFANQCLHYSALYMIGNSLFGWNCMAPWLSHPTRTADHVNAAKAFGRMRRDVSSARQLVTLQPMFSATLVRFARKDESYAVGFPILDLMFNQSW